MKEYWKIGELATLTGLTIRTLRYYDQISLFSPSEYTESGHRLYTKSDLSRLQQILSLKQIGLSLADIQNILTKEEKSTATDILETQISRLKKEIEMQQNLLYELQSSLKLSRNKKEMAIIEITNLFRVMKTYQEKYFTKQQLDSMKDFYHKVDENSLEDTEQEFKMILEKIRLEKEKGTPPSNNNVKVLARKWREILSSITVKDHTSWKQAEKFHIENPDNELQFGMDADIYKYIQEALD